MVIASYCTLEWQAVHPRNLLSSSLHYADTILPHNGDSLSFGFFDEKSSPGPFLTQL